MAENLRVVAYAERLDGGHRTSLLAALRDVGRIVDEASARSPTFEILTLELVPAAPMATLRAAQRTWSSTTGVGAAVVPAPVYQPGPKLLILDVDSTLIRQEVIELLAAHAGREAEVAAVTDAAMRGELDFAQSLHRRVLALRGLPVSVIDDVVDRIEFSDGAERLVRAYHDAGHPVGVVSGGFTQVLEPLAVRLRLTFAVANDLQIADGRLTGRVSGAVVDRRAKERVLREAAAHAEVPLAATLAVGDGANDLDMLAAAGLGVAYNARPAVRAAAGAALDLPDLDVARHLSDV